MASELVGPRVQLVVGEDDVARIHGQMVASAVLPHPVALVLEEVVETFAFPPADRVLVPRADQVLVCRGVSPGSRTRKVLDIPCINLHGRVPSGCRPHGSYGLLVGGRCQIRLDELGQTADRGIGVQIVHGEPRHPRLLAQPGDEAGCGEGMATQVAEEVILDGDLPGAQDLPPRFGQPVLQGSLCRHVRSRPLAERPRCRRGQGSTIYLVGCQQGKGVEHLDERGDHVGGKSAPQAGMEPLAQVGIVGLCIVVVQRDVADQVLYEPVAL